MATVTPFEQLTGALKVYVASAGETIPDVADTPSGNWVLLGSTDGDQKIKHGGKTQTFRDNDHQGPVKMVRHEEEITLKFKLVDLTLENYARVLSDAANVEVTTDTNGTNIKRLPLKRGATISEYSLLFRGDALSPYGVFPGMYVIPRCVLTSEPEPTYGKNQRAALDVEVDVLEDDTQDLGEEMGWFVVQIS